MQAFIGYLVLFIICLSALSVSFHQTKDDHLRKRLATLPISFLAAFVGFYAAIAVGGVILWVWAWIWVFLWEALQWLIEAVFYPLRWLI